MCEYVSQVLRSSFSPHACYTHSILHFLSTLKIRINNRLQNQPATLAPTFLSISLYFVVLRYADDNCGKTFFGHIYGQRWWPIAPSSVNNGKATPYRSKKKKEKTKQNIHADKHTKSSKRYDTMFPSAAKQQ